MHASLTRANSMQHAFRPPPSPNKANPVKVAGISRRMTMNVVDRSALRSYVVPDQAQSAKQGKVLNALGGMASEDERKINVIKSSTLNPIGDHLNSAESPGTRLHVHYGQ